MERWRQRWDCRKRQFFVLSLTVSSDALELRPTLLYGIICSIVAFPLTPKYVTLDDLEWPFYVIFFQVQNLPVYLYVQRHDICGEGIDNIFGEGHIYTCRMFVQSYQIF